MLKVLAGNLSAPLNIDGLHLQRFIERSDAIFQSLCDHLLLHDKILIPVQDYLAATGLLALLGERNLATLIAEDRIGFIRLRGSLGYVQGDHDGTVTAYIDPTGRRPDSAPAPASISAALALSRRPIKDRQRLQNVIFAGTSELVMEEVSGATQLDTIADLQQTNLWKDEFATANPALLNLPGMRPMEVRVLGPGTDVSANPVDACLALHLMNIELYLARQYQCESTHTASPIADSVALKLARLADEQADGGLAWDFLSYSSIPSISQSLIDDEAAFAEFIKLSNGRHAQAFRNWFRDNRKLSEKELVTAYIDVLQDTPMAQTSAAKTMRIAASLGLSATGLGSLLDAISSVTDNFVVDRIFREASMKFFIEDLRKFSNRIKRRES
jgi:hypothetical protein